VTEQDDAAQNDYERAVTRMEQARAHLKRTAEETTRAMNTAEEECNRAERNLCAFESSPGIPLPQYRRAVPSRARRL